MYKFIENVKTISGDIMKDEIYEKIIEKHKPSEDKVVYSLRAFMIGGLIGSLGEIIMELYSMCFHLSRTQSGVFMIITLIFIAALFTALGFFDNFVNYARCGLLIPITGFAHSMMSAALEYRKEGLVYGIGTNAFKLAGTVIVYGVVSAWTFGILRLIIGGSFL